MFIKKVLNIGDRAYVDLSLASTNTESAITGNRQFLDNVICGSSGSKVARILFNTIVRDMMGMVI